LAQKTADMPKAFLSKSQGAASTALTPKAAIPSFHTIRCDPALQTRVAPLPPILADQQRAIAALNDRLNC
jgi:hypothetical protein